MRRSSAGIAPQLRQPHHATEGVENASAKNSQRQQTIAMRDGHQLRWCVPPPFLLVRDGISIPHKGALTSDKSGSKAEEAKEQRKSDCLSLCDEQRCSPPTRPNPSSAR